MHLICEFSTLSHPDGIQTRDSAWRCSNVASILAAKSSTFLRFIGTWMRWLMCRCLKLIQAFHSLLTKTEKPDAAYNIQEIREPVELPHTQDELYKQIGVDPH